MGKRKLGQEGKGKGSSRAPWPCFCARAPSDNTCQKCRLTGTGPFFCLVFAEGLALKGGLAQNWPH